MKINLSLLPKIVELCLFFFFNFSGILLSRKKMKNTFNRIFFFVLFYSFENGYGCYFCCPFGLKVKYWCSPKVRKISIREISRLFPFRSPIIRTAFSCFWEAKKWISLPHIISVSFIFQKIHGGRATFRIFPNH